MEIGPYSSVASALQTAKNAFRMEAEKTRANIELAKPAHEAARAARADTARNVVLAVDVAEQQRDIAAIIANEVSDDQSSSTAEPSVDALELAHDVAQAQRRQSLIELYQGLEAEGRGPSARIGSRISILA